MSDWLGPQEWQAVALSLKVAFWAMLCSLPLGLFTAYALARWRFPGKGLVNALVHLPQSCRSVERRLGLVHRLICTRGSWCDPCGGRGPGPPPRRGRPRRRFHSEG